MLSDDRLKTERSDCPAEAVLLDESSVSTNIYKYVKQLGRQGVDSEDWRFWIVQGVAASLTPQNYWLLQQQDL